MKRFFLVCTAVVTVILLSVPMVAQQSAPGNASATADKAQKALGSAAQSPEVMDANDPLFGVPPLPQGKVSLIGGTVQKVDRLRNRVTVKTFGDNGKKMTVAFDERTHIYRDGVETTERGIRQGDRAYVDTMLDGARLFARNIRVVTNLQPTTAQGQVLAYDARSGRMTVRDELSTMPVTFRVTQQTQVSGGGGQGTIELVPGSLVSVRFSPEKGNRDVAREVSILVAPGNTITFAGKVRHLDLRSGTIAVESQTDNKTYELQFAPGVVRDNVTVGSEVTVSAVFSGRGYRAQTVAVNQARE